MMFLLFVGITLCSFAAINGQDISDCPQKCSHEFCSNPANIYEPCSQPSVTSPSCPDSCGTTFCSACYYSDKIVQPSFICDNLCSYPPTQECLYRWAFCLRGYSISRGIDTGEADDFRCYEYVCPLRG